MPPKENDKISIVRPDGSVFTGTRDQLKALQILGSYREQTLNDVQLDLRDAADKRAFSTTTEKLKTAGEGVLSGATLGGSDLLFNSTESDIRAETNPGYRLAGEVVGGVAPALLTGGTSAEVKGASLLSKVAGATPAGAATKLGRAAGSLTDSALASAAISGGIEGAAAGIQSTLSNATISNDPVTVEHVIAGMGTGAIFGSVLNAGLHGAGVALEKGGKKIEPEVIAAKKDLLPDDIYQPFKSSLSSVDDSLAAVDAGIDDLGRQISEVKAKDAATLKGIDDTVDSIKSQKRTADYEHTRQIDAMQQDQADVLKAVKKSYGDTLSAAELDARKAELDTGMVDRAERDVRDIREAKKLTDKGIKQASKERIAEAKVELATAESEHNKLLKQVDDETATFKKESYKSKNNFDLENSFNDLDAARADLNGQTAATRSPDLIAASENMNIAREKAKQGIASFSFNEAETALNEYHQAVLKANSVAGGIADVPQTVGVIPKQLVDRTTEVSASAARLEDAKKLMEHAKNFKVQTNHADNIEFAEKWLELTKKAKQNQIAAKRAAIDEIKKEQAATLDSLDTREVKKLRRQHAESQRTRDLQIEQGRTTKKEYAPGATEHLEKQTAEFKDLRKNIETLKGIPHTAAEFRAMGSTRIDNIVSAVKAVSNSKTTSALAISTKASVDELAEKMGLKLDGGPAEKLLGIWKATKGIGEIGGELSDVEGAVLNYKKSIGNGLERSIAASAFSRATGTGTLGYFGAKGFMQGAGEAKMKVQKMISDAAKKVGRSFQKPTKNYIVPKLEPLWTKLDGSRDIEKNKNKAATNRINEFTGLAAGINDLAFKAIEPMMQDSPDFAQVAHQQLIEKHRITAELLPKNNTFNVFRGITTWVANDVETYVTAKVLRAFYHPLSVIKEAAEGNIDSVSMNAVIQIWPEIHSAFKINVMNTLDMSKLGYKELRALSHMGIETSSCFSGENIVDAQRQFVENPAPRQGDGGKQKSVGGRPAATEQATPGQMLSNKGMA